MTQEMIIERQKSDLAILNNQNETLSHTEALTLATNNIDKAIQSMPMRPHGKYDIFYE